MKVLKKIFKFFGYTLLLLLLLMFLLPYLFQDRIKEEIKLAINDNVNAEVEFSDVSLSLFKEFPYLNIGVEDISVLGIGDFENVLLFSADNAGLSINLFSVFNDDPYDLKSIRLDNPFINVWVKENGIANYDITKSVTTEEPTEDLYYKLALQSYSVNNGHITYRDDQLQMLLDLTNIDHEGNGDFTQDIFDLRTQTKADAMTVRYEGMTYLSRVPLTADADININITESKYTLKDNRISLNSLDLEGSGMVQLAGDDIITKANITAPKNEFKDFISILPAAIIGDLKGVETSGTADINLNIDGTYGAISGKLPLIKSTINIVNGYLKYPDLPDALKDVNVDLSFETFDNKAQNFELNIPKLKALLGSNSLAGKLSAKGNQSNPTYDGVFTSNINLASLQRGLPLEGINKLEGLFDANLSLKATQQDIDASNFGAIAFDGKADLKDFVIENEGQPAVSASSISASASPARMTLKTSKVKLGKSDMTIDGDVKNPLAYFINDQMMEANVKVQSDYLLVDEWSSSTTTEESEVPSETIAIDSLNEAFITDAKINYNADFQHIQYEDVAVKNLSSSGTLNANNIAINNFSAKLDESNIQMNGNIQNAYNYLMKNDTLRGDITVSSKRLNLNPYLVEDTDSSTSEEEYITPIIPKKVKININTDIDELNYTNIDMFDLRGMMRIADGNIVMQDVSTRALGGKMKFDGLYSTSDPEDPNFSFKYNLSEIKFNETVEKLLTVEQLAPIMKYINGFFNSTLVMSGSLDDKLFPKLESLNASGFIETLNGAVNGLEPLNKISDKLGIEKLKGIDLSNTKNWFDIKDGKFFIKEFDYNYQDIDMKVSGNHSLTQEMDYQIIADIPREMLKANAITNAANTGLSLLENEADKLGLNISQGDYIKMQINLGGNITQPSVKLKPLSSGGKSAKDAVKEEISNNIEEAKQKAQDKIDSTITVAKDSITNVVTEKVDTLKAQAKEKATEVVNQVKDEIKDQVGDKVDSTLKEILPDSLGNKVLDNVKDQIGDKVNTEDIKDKLEGWNPFKKKKKDND